MDVERKSRGGRPRIHKVRAGDRVPLSLRVTPAVKRSLDEIVKKTGRSQSQEAELRLERSFDRENLLIESLELAYGGPIAGLLVWIGEAMQGAAMREGYKRAKGHVPRGEEILAAPEAREQAGFAVETMGRWLRGKGLPEGKGIGIGIAAHILDELEARRRLTGGTGSALYESASSLMEPLLPPKAEESTS